MDSQTIIWIIAAGGFGGLLHALSLGERLLFPVKTRENNRLSLGLGFIGDILLGIGAGIGVTFFIMPEIFLKQIALSLIAGFGGGSFLGSLLNRLSVRAERQEREALGEDTETVINRYEDIIEDLTHIIALYREKLERRER